jgi:hypothetical protein
LDDPTALLLPPSEPDASVSNGFANPIDALNYFSPSAWINSAVEGLTGVDVFGWMTGWVSGDWSAIWKFGDAMSNLGDCLQQVAINIQKGVIDLDLSWDGNASDAAYQYFSDFAAAVSGQQRSLYDIVDNYHKAAVGAWELSNQLGNIMQAVADKAVLAGIAAAAGTITAESGIGAVVGYGAAALIVVDMLRLINKASTIINTAGTIIAGLAGGGMDAADQGGDLSAVPLPSVAYSLPRA